jgi:hypothetical protein
LLLMQLLQLLQLLLPALLPQPKQLIRLLLQ